MGFRTVTGSRPAHSGWSGFTLIELLVVISIIATLLTIAMPRYFQSLERSRETVLRHDLAVMRDAIDKFRADRGTYPETLDALVDAGYIRRVPEDPMTKSTETWISEMSDDPDATGVRDVRSGAEGVGKAGMPYEEW